MEEVAFIALDLAILLLLLLAIDADRQLKGSRSMLPPALGRLSSAWAGFAARVRNAQAARKAEWKREKAARRSRSKKLTQVRVPKKVPAGIITESTCDYRSIEPGLEALFIEVREGNATLEGYKARILEAQSDIQTLAGDVEDIRKHDPMDSEEYAEWREIIADEKDAVRWRLEWVEKQLLKQADLPDKRFDDHGKWAAFRYADTDGVATNRRIRNWAKAGRYIIGHCDAAKAERTFRQDRIEEWRSG